MAKHIVIIGGGSAGVEAAKTAARYNAQVTLISNEEIGGRAIWHSLLPSKKWLKAARYKNKGLDDLLDRIRASKKRWSDYNKQLLHNAGVRIIYGNARYMHTGRIDVYSHDHEKLDELCPDASIIASGSKPVFPEGLQPDGKRVIAPRFLSRLTNVPRSMVIIGGGVTGIESAYLFSALDVNVTLLLDENGFLPGFDNDLRLVLKEHLKNAGLTIVEPATATHIDRNDTHVLVHTQEQVPINADMAFVAVGRNGDMAQLGLNVLMEEPKATISLETDGYGRTQFKNIYAVGDVVNRRKIANQAMAQANIAAAHACGADVTPFDAHSVIAAVYSEPGLAQIGMLHGKGIKPIEMDYLHGLLPHINNENGRIKIAVNENGALSGMAVCGPMAAEIIAPAGLLIRSALPLDQFKTLYAASPTYSELFYEALRAV